MTQSPTEIVVRVKDVHDLFRSVEFDPFEDDAPIDGLLAVRSFEEMVQLPHLVSKLKSARLLVLVAAESLTPQTERDVRRAVERYCAHAIAQARRKLAAMRWVGLKTSLVGLAFFGVSLAASSAVLQLQAVPEAFRTLASEGLIVAGWVLLWQPLDTLVAGCWPHWEEVRTYKAIQAVQLRVSAMDNAP